MTRYITLAEAMALHQAIMERTGFAPAPLRDQGLLESALARPRMAAYYVGADIVRQATLLGVGIAQNQPFLDGNKRTAFAAVRVFLRTNGYRFTGPRLELASQLEAIATRADSLEAASRRLGEWLRARIEPVQDHGP